MTLTKYKEPTKYAFYKWIKEYPDSKYWVEHIKQHPNLKLSPLTGTKEFYIFVKTACRNRSLEFTDWDEVEKKILKEISCLKKNDLEELKNIFKHLINFYKTPAIKQGHSVENLNGIRRGNYIEKGIEHGKFYEKELQINRPKGGILVYDKK